MLAASSLVLAQVETQYVAPGYFNVVLLSLLALGAIGWLVAAVLGFSRARTFGTATRWFALAALCLVLFHLQLVLTVLAASSNPNMLLSIGAFFPLFIALGAICAVIGFARLVNPR